MAGAAAARVVVVGLGSTTGLRAVEDELVGALRRAGAHALLARARPRRDVPTLMLTDLAWALAAREAARRALRPGDVPVYVTTTAALLWPRPGAIRFDALAAANRPGRHGLWQRPLERRRLAQAPLLVPQDPAALREGGAGAAPALVLPLPIEPSGPPGPRDLAAVTYAANPAKKGLDRVLAAWREAVRPGEELVVAGVTGGPSAAGVRYAGRLPAAAFRALLRRARVYVTAPRREDFGLTQLEALADGCRVVTTPAPGPYAALPLLRAPRAGGGPSSLGWVVDDEGLGAALRAALDDEDPRYPEAALRALAPFRRAAVDRVVAEELLPRLR